MRKINANFLKLQNAYLFSEIKARVNAYKTKNSDAEIISLGIGDVTLPLVPSVISAMQSAVTDMSQASTFKGYGAEQGYEFLRENIAKFDYKNKGLDITPEEICVGDGIKSDIANITELFSTNASVALCDPVYPAYLDCAIMTGRAGNYKGGKWSKIINLECTAESDFLPSFPIKTPDIIYLCYPNNPTGAVMNKSKLTEWVRYAKNIGAIIFYDAAYEAYICEDYPHSIYECEGAKDCAIEFKSYSKTAGFTGVRCGYTVIPKSLMCGGVSLLKFWNRRQSSKFNGVSYISQCGANAIYSESGQKEIKQSIDYYMENAHYIHSKLINLGASVWGGVNAPYIWVKTPQGITSWEMFDIMLTRAGVVCTPGIGFGSGADNYIRLTAFNTKENTQKAVKKIIDSKIFE